MFEIKASLVYREIPDNQGYTGKPYPQIIIRIYLCFMYMAVLPASMYENHMCAWCPQSPEVGIRAPGMCYRWSLGPL